jgi:hypothetical protein
LIKLRPLRLDFGLPKGGVVNFLGTTARGDAEDRRRRGRAVGLAFGPVWFLHRFLIHNCRSKSLFVVDSLKSGIPFTNKRVRECNKGIPVCHKNLQKFSLSLVGAQGAFVQNIYGTAGVSGILPANTRLPHTDLWDRMLSQPRGPLGCNHVYRRGDYEDT